MISLSPPINNDIFITSFSQRGYFEYGKHLIESFLEHGGDARLIAYYERKLPKFHPKDPRVTYVNLRDYSDFNHLSKIYKASDPLFSGLTHGEQKNEQVYNFRFDANKFFKKVYVMTLHASETPPHLFAWIDADTYFHEDIPDNFLRSLKPDDGDFAAALLRPSSYTETGFIVFDTNHPQAQTFMDTFFGMYSTGAFKFLGEFHDCYAFDMVSTLLDTPIKDISEGKERDHPFIHSVLGKYLDHLKGPKRKKLGRSPIEENSAKHDTAHWNPPEAKEEIEAEKAVEA